MLKYVVCFCKGCDGCCVFCIVMRGPVGARIWESMSVSSCRCCVLCASCGSSECCILHDFQFVDASGGCKRRPHGRGILQSRSQDCIIGSHVCLPHPVAVSAFSICSGMCACNDML